MDWTKIKSLNTKINILWAFQVYSYRYTAKITISNTEGLGFGLGLAKTLHLVSY